MISTDQTSTGTQPWDNSIDYTHYQTSMVRRIVTRYKIADYITIPTIDQGRDNAATGSTASQIGINHGETGQNTKASQNRLPL